ncbi:MAG: BBP7 family outer membrane beta-barrel protein [Planctomycetota bacterium]
MSKPTNSLCLAMAMLAMTSTALSQSISPPSSGRRVTTDLERNARTVWQPVRDLSKRRVTRPSATEIQRVDHVDGSYLPAPPASVPTVAPGAPPEVMVDPAGPVHQPLDGQIMLEPIHDTGCDALPSGECGCATGTCDGACGVTCGGCDGCFTGGCCTGDPMCGEYRDCDAWRPCVTLCWPQDGWFSAEYLLWWQSGMDLPPLVSTDALPSAANPGGVGQVLYGGDEVLTDSFDGIRLQFGFWLDQCHTWGIGADYFQIGEERDRYSNGAGSGLALLVRPFVNVNDGSQEDAQLVVGDGIAGTVDVDVHSELSGWGLHVRHMNCAQSGCSPWLYCGCPDHYCSRTWHMFGFRQVELNEGVRIDERLTTIPPPSPTTNFTIFDRFQTRNQFNGVEVGWGYRQVRGYWSFDALLRLGVGNTRQTVNIAGQTIIDANAAQTGGLLAQTSNIGRYDRDEFAVLPELDLTLGYQLTEQLRATLGYTFLYWSNVVRPGDQIDRLVDPDQIPSDPPANPAVVGDFPEFAFDNTDYWAQGLSFGGEYRW